jgi:AcrR family transcriptional regulator
MATQDGDAALGPRARRTAQRRTEILDAALDAMSRHGYQSASLAQIAQQVGISAPSLLHHFRNKEALLTALLEYRDQISWEADEHLGDLAGGDFLRHLVTTAGLNEQRPGLTQLYAVLVGESLTADHPAKAYFTDRFAWMREHVRDDILLAVADPDVPEAAVLEAATAIIAVMDGLQYQYLLDPGCVSMPAVVERTIRALLADLRAGH